MRDIINNPIYRKAFLTYLRYGTPPDIFIKAQSGEVHATDKYIWRTQGDDKVRPDHAALNGQIFSWDNPPPVGHPGHDYNCRCMAEPYLEGIDPADLKEMSSETLIYVPEDKVESWNTLQLVWHYFTGKHAPLSLEEIGHMQSVISYVQNQPIDEAGETISRKAINYFAELVRRENAIGNFDDHFENGYHFESIAWAHGKANLKGSANGWISDAGPFFVLNLVVVYKFDDVFMDPFDLLDISKRTGVSLAALEVGDTYVVTGSWRARIEAVVYKNRELSQYRIEKPEK